MEIWNIFQLEKWEKINHLAFLEHLFCIIMKKSD